MTETVQVALITAIATLVSAALATTATIIVTHVTSRAERREARRSEARKVLSQLVSHGRLWSRTHRSAVEFVTEKSTPEEAKAAWSSISKSDAAREMAADRDDFHALMAEAILLIDDGAIQAALQELRAWFSDGTGSPLNRVIESFDGPADERAAVRDQALKELEDFRERIAAVELAASRAVRVRF